MRHFKLSCFEMLFLKTGRLITVVSGQRNVLHLFLHSFASCKQVRKEYVTLKCYGTCNIACINLDKNLDIDNFTNYPLS